MADYDESIVEVIPCKTNSFSLKTRRQGGGTNWQHNRDHKTVKAKYGTKWKEISNDSESFESLKLKAWNILKHSQSTEKQRAVANRFLDEYEKKSFNFRTKKLIHDIAKTLNRK
jgi:hypothetical protein